MKVHFLLFFVFFFVFTFFSCGENKVIPNSEKKIQKTIEKPIKKIDSNQLLIDKIAQTYITNINVEKRLTAFGDTNQESKIKIYTNKGKISIKLYNNTPLHRANFVLLAKRKLFDNTLFYRVMNNFMIQGGNSDNPIMRSKIERIGRYRIPNEIKKTNYHKKGAIAMAVSPEEQNFGKKSSAINFYIIEGRKMTESYFKEKLEKGKSFSDKQKQKYITIGGSPHLDGDYTVFGEVISGMSVVNRISNVSVDEYNWPRKDVIIDSIRAY